MKIKLELTVQHEKKMAAKFSKIKIHLPITYSVLTMLVLTYLSKHTYQSIIALIS